MKVDHYSMLEVSPRASEEVIHAAYRALCLKNGSNERRLKALNAAKEILLTDKRADYDEEREAKIAKQIGQYRVVELIAQGGFGKTYKGEHITLGTPVCIKHASKVSPQDEQIMMEEAKAIWDLRHWGIPAIRDIHKLADGSIALVMSYVPGKTIEQIVEKHEGLDPEHVAWISERLLNVLNYLHMHGVVHGDVKPQNVIIQPESHTVTLVDYGLSAIRPKDEDNKGYTPIFASPEQQDGRPLLPESDLFSLGKTMIYMLGGDAEKVTVPKKTPDALCAFVKRLIAFDVLSRPSWHKEDLIETFRKVRYDSFGRSSSGMKPLPV